jgi:hypothetical protein
MEILQRAPENEADTDLLEKPDLKVDDGDHDRFSHYVKKNKIVESAVTGKAVRALCGKKSIPACVPGQKTAANSSHANCSIPACDNDHPGGLNSRCNGRVCHE